MPTHDIQTSNQILSDYRPPQESAKTLENEGNLRENMFSSAGIKGTHFQLARKLVYLVYL